MIQPTREIPSLPIAIAITVMVLGMFVFVVWFQDNQLRDWSDRSPDEVYNRQEQLIDALVEAGVIQPLNETEADK